MYPPPQWRTRIVYDEIGRKQLMGLRGVNRTTNQPTKRVTPLAPLLGSDTDVDVDLESDEDEGDRSILLKNDDGYRLVDLRLCL